MYLPNLVMRISLSLYEPPYNVPLVVSKNVSVTQDTAFIGASIIVNGVFSFLAVVDHRKRQGRQAG